MRIISLLRFQPRIPDYVRLYPLAEDLQESVRFETDNWPQLAPEDQASLAVALDVAAGHEGVQVVALAAGPTDFRDTLRKALAMGATEAVLLETAEGQSHSFVEIATKLFAYLSRASFDLLVIGRLDPTRGGGARLGDFLARELSCTRLDFNALPGALAESGRAEEDSPSSPWRNSVLGPTTRPSRRQHRRTNRRYRGRNRKARGGSGSKCLPSAPHNRKSDARAASPSPGEPAACRFRTDGA